MLSAVSWGSLVDRVGEGAPDVDDARRRAERFCEAATAIGLDPGCLEAGRAGPDDDVAHIVALACQRAPYLATLLTRDPMRLLRVASDPYLRREKPAAAITAL